MRPRFLTVISILVLAILAIVFWLQPVRPPASPEQPPMGQRTNASAIAANVAIQSVSETPTVISTPDSQKSSVATGMGKAEVITKFVEGKNVPVEFYGLVIDQDSNALAGVEVKVSVQKLNSPNPASLELGATEIPFERITSQDGRFEIKGLTGESLDLASIQKDGYEAEPTKRGFGPTSGSFENPVVFKMWSTTIHEQLITGDKKFPIVPDGRPYVIDLIHGTIAESGEGDLKVWIKYPSQVTRGQLYDWSSEVDAVNGGLLEEHDLNASMYSAPADGYTPSFQVEQQIKGGQYGLTGEKRFYVKLKNGQDYGRITVNLYAPYTDQIPGLIRLSYAINPSGSKILR